MRSMACGLMLAALRLLLNVLAFGIHCRPDELHRSSCNGKRTNSAAHRLAEVHPFRSDFEWMVGCGGCSARRLEVRAGVEAFVYKLVTGLYMGSL